MRIASTNTSLTVFRVCLVLAGSAALGCTSTYSATPVADGATSVGGASITGVGGASGEGGSDNAHGSNTTTTSVGGAPSVGGSTGAGTDRGTGGSAGTSTGGSSDTGGSAGNGGSANGGTAGSGGTAGGGGTAGRGGSDACTPNPCEHGTCTVDGDTHACDCDDTGYTGDLCQTEINECDPDPCENGSCINGIGYYDCDCGDSGYTGEFCETLIQDCAASPCENGGACTDTGTTRVCGCTGTGATGVSCEVDINECAPNPCEHGTCENGINEYTCDCSGTGYSGTNCQINIDDCASNPCQHGGECTDGINEYTCDCSGTGYDGDNCQNTGGATSTGGGGTGGQVSVGEGPCNIYAAADTPCVAAYSTVRVLHTAHTGPLYQVRKGGPDPNTGSGGETLDIEVLPNGFADAAAHEAFCGSESCTFSKLYDQSGQGNDLTVAKAGCYSCDTTPPGSACTDDYESDAMRRPTMAGGNNVFALYMEPHEGYRTGGVPYPQTAPPGNGMPTGNDPQGIYSVAEGLGKRSSVVQGCCWNFGNASTNNCYGPTGQTNALFFGKPFGARVVAKVHGSWATSKPAFGQAVKALPMPTIPAVRP